MTTSSGPCVPDVVPSLDSAELAKARRVEARLRQQLDAHRHAIGETAAQLNAARVRREELERAEGRAT